MTRFYPESQFWRWIALTSLSGLVVLSLSKNSVGQSWGIEPKEGSKSKNEQLRVLPEIDPEAEDQVKPRINRTEAERYRQVIERTREMVRDPFIQKLVAKYGLNIVDLTWEDTGRYYNSAVGPNISDLTIQIQHDHPTKGAELFLMPVIRYPNFRDLTADIPLERFFILVGNEKGRTLKRLNLRTYLGNLREYLHDPGSWPGNKRSLLAPRDTHVLVSAQACFLPIPAKGAATFNPVLFNYQSHEGNPAVLAILVTREGTSATIIDNKRDGFEAGPTWGQRLFFNKNGKRTSLVGERPRDFGIRTGQGELSSRQAEASGMNMVMVIQVPLKQSQRFRGGSESLGGPSFVMKNSRSNVEAAIISHGKVEGSFTEIDGLPIERDPRFPIRVTVQFYKATDNGVVNESDIRLIHRQISKVYKEADYVGSLVLDGPTGRPTEYTGLKKEPPNWWQDFWQNYEQNTGQSREEALEMLERLRGKDWKDWFLETQEELEKALEELHQNKKETR